MSKQQTDRFRRKRGFLRGFTARGHHEFALDGRIPELLPDEAFRIELRREMLRSDRSGSPVTVVVFGLMASGGADSDRDAETLELLGSVIAKNSRLTDGKGWYRDAKGLRAGLILVDTTTDKAGHVIAKVMKGFDKSLDRASLTNGNRAAITCEIFAHPSNGVRDGDRRGPGSSSSNGRSESKGPAGNGRSDPAAEFDRAADAKADVKAVVSDTSDAQLLLARPLPVWKRMFDITGSLLGLILISPVLLAIAAFIKCVSCGPIFFRQERVGYLGQTFMCWKFRTMHQDCDTQAHQDHLKQLISAEPDAGDETERPMVKLDDVDPEIIPFGNILRKTYLDELPQLVNVMRGEMSLVGPRPSIPYEIKNYQAWNKGRFGAVPGMTGLWQVSGKNKTTFKRMVRLDIEYARERSFWLDMKILFKTGPMILGEVCEAIIRRKMEA